MADEITKSVHDLTWEDWVRYEWIDITSIGSPCRIFARCYERSPESAHKARMGIIQAGLGRNGA